VNFSAIVLQSDNTASHILNCLRAHGLTPDQLAVEVTESVIARQSSTVLHVLGELREAGVRVMMDDFGTGYSSLASLMNLPVDVIKIDKVFINVLEKRPETQAVLRAIVELAVALQIEVICEGIERCAQSEIIGHMGTIYGQGYLYSFPLTVADIERALLTEELTQPPSAISSITPKF
jgi:EAL domain-containing protein (putative c-di-GMP-specific phosphodiesterase class I)